MKKLFKLISDIHLEFCFYKDVIPKNASEINLILAGDIAPVDKNYLYRFLEQVCSTYKNVIYVCGNHEFYDNSITNGRDKIKQSTTHLSNLYILENDVIYIDDVRIIGSTLWTDAKKGDPWIKLLIEGAMNDYRKIRIGDSKGYPYKRKFRINDMIGEHLRSINFIINELKKDYDKKTLVISHHAPTEKSVPEKYKDKDINFAYFSYLEELFYNYNIDIWVHGHTHSSFDYKINDSRIICNPRGYSTSKVFEKDINTNNIDHDFFKQIFINENRTYDPNKIFEI